MNGDEQLTKIQLEMILQIVQTQRSTALLLEQHTRAIDALSARMETADQTQHSTAKMLDAAVRLLDKLMKRPFSNEAERQIKWEAELKRIDGALHENFQKMNDHGKQVDVQVNAIQVKMQQALAGMNIMYYQKAIANLQEAVSELARRIGMNRDAKAINGIFPQT